MKRTLTLVGTTALALGLLAGPAQAAPAEHVFVPEQYDGQEQASAEENPCGAWAATFRESRTGGYRLVLAPGGQVDGEAHVNGSIHGLVELVPVDASLPTYTGSYREKVNGVFLGADESGEDALRVAQYRLRVPLQGSDGSRLTLVLSGKITLDANGRTVVERGTQSCT